MHDIKSVCLIGLGAIGGAFGSRIMENCPGSLSVAACGKRYENYTASGVRINGQIVPFNYIRSDKTDTAAELVLVAVKHHHLEQTITDIRPLIGPDTIILSLLNGITSEEIIGKEFGKDKMLHSFCVGTDAVREGTDIAFTNIGQIVFGDAAGSRMSQKVRAVREFFDRSKVPYTIPEDIIRELWWKFMLNVGINQVSAVLRAPYGAFAREGYARELMFDASREVISIAGKAGIGLTDDDIVKYTRIIDELSPEGMTSMYQDVEAGRKTEVEIFSGAVIEMGRKYNVPTPVNDILYRLIKAIEESGKDI